ncbi:tetratricopeptide repeat protein [Alienimonas sp. DA493]|uniref:tetratricopeptide repeat protein n=1 Tax=Alienimonas sp. DA493 TaxID=3373605 RepID=UPI0037548229
MPASLLVCLPLLFAPVQPPGDGVAPAVPGQDPLQPNASEVEPFDDPASTAQDDPFGAPAEPQPPQPAGTPAPPTEPSVGVPMQDVDPAAEGDPPPAVPADPLIEGPTVPAEPRPNAVDLPLDPAAPDVIVVEDPAVTVIEQPSPLSELIRNPYDVYDLREHVAVPADCLLARQACLPCTRCVTRCAGCCGGAVVTEEVPVPGVNPYAAEQIGQILLNRTPADPRVSYLMFVLRYREARYDEAFAFLEEAVALEAANPDAFPNYGEFMTPIQGRSRVYLERVRDLAGLGVI